MTEDTERPDPLSDHPPVSRNLIKNPISLIGLALAAVALANIVLLIAIDVLASQPSPYIGILAYMVAPGILVFGLVLVPIGRAGSNIIRPCRCSNRWLSCLPSRRLFAKKQKRIRRLRRHMLRSFELMLDLNRPSQPALSDLLWKLPKPALRASVREVGQRGVTDG